VNSLQLLIFVETNRTIKTDPTCFINFLHRGTITTTTQSVTTITAFRVLTRSIFYTANTTNINLFAQKRQDLKKLLNLTKKSSAANMNQQETAKKLWRQADAVCFDVDSTVIQDEAIDELAAFCGKGDEVQQL